MWFSAKCSERNCLYDKDMKGNECGNFFVLQLESELIENKINSKTMTTKAFMAFLQFRVIPSPASS